MPLNFPTDPTVNQTYSFGSNTYKWDGGKWISVVTEPSRLVSGSNSLEINGNNLVWVGGGVIAGTITAALTGAASSNVLKAGDTMTGALVVPLASAATPSLTFTGNLNTGIFSPGANQLAVATNGTGKVFVGANGNVGIGTTDLQYKLEVNGSFAATTKSFVIPHPTKQNYKLQHGSLEGPENGVYVRGRSGSGVIKLPEYWIKLIDPSSITVTLTPIGQNASLWVERIENNKIYIGKENSSVAYFYMVNAERIDVELLKVEIPNLS